MKLWTLLSIMVMVMMITVEAGLDVEDLIAKGYTCSLADSRYEDEVWRCHCFR